LGAVYALYAVGTFIFAVRHRKRRRISLLRCGGILIAGGAHHILLALFPQTPMYCLCTTAMVFLMYSSEEEASRSVDTVSGALCRETLMSDMRNLKANGMNGHLFAVALDNFKLTNETYGIEGGNAVLRQLVFELTEEFGKDSVYRFGGDVFAVYIHEDTETAKVLDRLRQLFARPIHTGTLSVRLSACIGIIHLKLHNADEFAFALEYAVTQAKCIGRGAVFDMAESSTDLMKRQKAIEQALYDNISKKQFEVHYQPIWDVRQQKFHSMEALARLNVPGYGYVSPEEFIRMAERNGTILQIGLLVLEEVCRFIREARPEQHGIEFIEVNLSVVQCTQEKIYNSIREVLDRYRIPPSMINLEITESAAAYSEKKLIQNMARMSLMDLTFSLDDYGSGYSNINYLVSLPFNIVKIDKYLVWSAAKSVQSREILEHTISMFKAIRLRVVTEGIEDPEMVRMVSDMGADYIQGFYYSKPVPREKVPEILSDAYCRRFRQNNAV
jgi:diguanylate cyclase (GGDEF)-like protein